MNTTDRASEPRSATRNVVVALVVAVIVIGLDQLTKAWAVRELSDGHTIDLIGSLRFNLAFNTGASFSIGSGLGPLFSAIVVVVVVLLLRYAREVTNPVGLVAVGMVVGGAVGNVLDRIFRAGVGDDRGFLGGAVVDFVDLQWWPIFNIADIGVVCGGLLLVISAWIQAEDDMADDAPDAAADDSSTAD